MVELGGFQRSRWWSRDSTDLPGPVVDGLSRPGVPSCPSGCRLILSLGWCPHLGEFSASGGGDREPIFLYFWCLDCGTKNVKSEVFAGR